MNISSAFASPLPLAQPRPSVASLAPPVTNETVTASPTTTELDVDPRNAGDANMAASFAQTLAGGPHQDWRRPPRVRLHPDSTLGRWYVALDKAFMDPGFLQWVKEQKLEPGAFTFIPSRGEIQGYVSGQLKTFSPSDDSGWSDVSRTLMSTLALFAPEPGQEVRFPWYGAEDEVPAQIVAQFYGEPVNPTPEQAATRLRQLKQNPSFQMPDSYVSARSENALLEQDEQLGICANRHATITALKSQVDDMNGRIDLNKVQISIDPRSELFKSTQRRQMSLAEHLKYEGYKVPINSEQAHGLAFALSFDLAQRAPKAESGGVVSLMSELSDTARRRLKSVVKQWLTQHADQTPRAQTGPATAPLLNRLLDTLPESTRLAIQKNPAAALDQLIRSPEALALGKAIQPVIKKLDSDTSASESVSAALIHELSAGADKSPFNLAGYNLYSVDNAGASHAEILKRFTAHLEKTAGVEGAPIAARLLLTAAAPELLVKDVPPNLLYGSHTWANFVIKASRIEQQVPGALANMTFSQVMEFGSAPSASYQSDDNLYAASFLPTISWGIANGVIQSTPGRDYSDTDFRTAEKALNEQLQELEWASTTLSAPPPTRKALALAELKRVFPEVDPELKFLKHGRETHNATSLLDIYMSGPISANAWRSIDEKIPYDSLRSRFAQLIPDINATFNEQFEKYRGLHESAIAIQFAYQLSLLPMAEREVIKQSTVSFHELRRPYTKGSMTYVYGKRYFKPQAYSAEEASNLQGKHAMLMRVENPKGETTYYAYATGQSTLKKVEGFPTALPDNPAKNWSPNVNPNGTRLNIDDSYYYQDAEETGVKDTRVLISRVDDANNQRDPIDTTTYLSTRNRTLGLTPGKFFTRDYDALQVEAAGITQQEQQKATNQKITDFVLSLVPFYDGIRSAIKGDVSGAIFNIGFDAFGFIIPGLLAFRRAYKGGRGGINAIKSGIIAGIGESTGYTDLHNLPKNIGKASRAGYKDIKYIAKNGDDLLARLKGNYELYSPSKKYTQDAIVKGFFRTGVEATFKPTVAVFKKGAWYAYNTVTRTPFGFQLLQQGAIQAIEA